MAGEWTSISLGKVCTKIGSGATPRGGNDVYLATGPYSLIRSQNIYNDGFRHDGLAFIGDVHAAELANVEVLKGDVLLNITGDSVARACQVDPGVLPARVNQHVAIIRPDPNKLDPRFLRYFLVSPAMQDKLLSWAGSGGTRNALTKGMIESFDVPAPEDIDEQRAIAHILGTLDDKIELNRRMNETLEAMARALFKSWFVDFDPVRAKAEGRDPGLPKPLADLFPARLVDSELGEIPEGWEVGTLGDLIDTIKGRSYKSEELVESDTALVTLKSFARGGGYRPDGLKSFAGTYKPEQVVHPGELVIACTDVTQAAEVIGRPAIVRGTGVYRRLVASLDTLIVRPRDSSMTRSFLYFLGGTEAFVAHTFAHTTGTTVLHLAKQAVPSFMFARPSTQLVKRFDALAGPTLDRIQALEEESGTLAAMRDTLLPKLISGELRLANAEQFMGEDELMADMNLTQAEADALIAMEKHRVNEERSDFPMGGQSLVLPLQSPDKREQFLLDLSRGRIDLLKVKMQNRGRQVVVLVRLDLGGAPHRNPDGEEISVPHLHVYREGFGDKWAVPVPADRFTATNDVWQSLEEFTRFCNITQPPHIDRGLFT